MIKTINKCLLITLCVLILLPLCFVIAEAEENSVNVSFGKNVYVSSFYSIGYKGTEFVLTDGKTDAFCPTESMFDTRYYIIDLAGYYNINKIELDPRYQYYDYNDTRDTSVYVSDKLLKGTEIETATYIGNGYSGAEAKKITLDTDTYGRYVYVYKPVTDAKSMLCFSEISVYADKNAYLGDYGFYAISEESVEVSFSYDVEESKMTKDNFILFANDEQVKYKNYRIEKNKFYLDFCGLDASTEYKLIVTENVTQNGKAYTIPFETEEKLPESVTVAKYGKVYFENGDKTELNILREGIYNVYQNGSLKEKVNLPAGRYYFDKFIGNITLEKVDFYFVYNSNTAQNVTCKTVYGEDRYVEFGEVSSSEISIDFINNGYFRITLWGRSIEGVSRITPIFDSCSYEAIELDENLVPKSFIINTYSGTHSLKLSSMTGNALVEYVEITYLPNMTEKIEKEFCCAIENAKKSQGVKKVLKEYEDSLGFSVSNLENGVFYSEPCYGDLSEKSFSNAESILNYIQEKMYVARSVQRNWILQDNTKLEVTVPSYGFEGQGIYFGALYNENGKLLTISAVRYRAQKSVKFSFVNTEYNDKMIFKTFLIDGFTNLKPLEKYSNVFKEYYVSTTGSDDNVGSASFPFATVEKALSAVSEVNSDMTGDIIINIDSGIYFISETLLIDNSNCGKNGYNVILRGDENGETLLSGGEEITGWSLYKNGIYVAKAEGFTQMRNLYINGLAAERAKSEKVLEYSADTDKGFVTKSTDISANFAHPDELEVVWNRAFVTRRLPVENVTQSGTALQFSMKQPYYDRVNNMDSYIGKTFSGKQKFYIENALELLDRKGEFYFDQTKSLVYYYPFDEENLSTSKVFAPKTEGILKIAGTDKENKAECIMIENISFKYGAWNQTSYNGYSGLQSSCYYDLSKENAPQSKIPGQVTLTNCENVLLKNLNISSCGSSAVVMDTGVKFTEISGCVITDVSGTSIDIGKAQHSDFLISADDEICVAISISNNIIRRTGLEYFNAPGMAIYYADGVEIKHNDIKECSYSGLSVGWGWNANHAKKSGRFSIINNRIEDVMCTLYDGGIIYTLGVMPDTLIEGNYLAKNNDTGYGAVYCDSGSRYITIRENLISNVKWWLFTQSGYDVKNIDAYGNYSDNLYFTHNNEPLVDTNVEIPVYVVSPYYGSALEIYNNSGVEGEYKEYMYSYESPTWKTSIVKNTPKN